MMEMKKIYGLGIALLMASNILASCQDGGEISSGAVSQTSREASSQPGGASESTASADHSGSPAASSSEHSTAASAKASSVSRAGSPASSGKTSSVAAPEKPNADNRKFSFNGPLSKEVLGNYLSRAVTHEGLGVIDITPDPDFEEDVRMLINIGAKFIGRATHSWGSNASEEHFSRAKAAADYVHAKDSRIIMQAAVFEAAYKTGVNATPIPAWVFEAYNLPVQTRNFRYDDMLGPAAWIDFWAPGASVPDLTKTETQMWFYYRCCRYIDAGYEAIHMGQIEFYGQKDTNRTCATDLIKKIRAYAAKHGRRKWVLLDAHTHGMTGSDGKLLFDFHSYPIRYKLGAYDSKEKYRPATLEAGYGGGIYGKSLGGENPSGWSIGNNFFIVEIDNYGTDTASGINDDITWLAKLPEKHRNSQIAYFDDWIKSRYSYGYLQMPTKRVLQENVSITYTLAAEYDPITVQTRIFKANRHSGASIYSFNLEDTIKSLWAKTS